MERDELSGKVIAALPYATLLYYLEITRVMVAAVIVAGKTAAVGGGVTAAVLLTVHLVRFALRLPGSRKTQLVIMTVHGASTLAYLAGILVSRAGTWQGLPVTAARAILLAFELAGIWFLAGEHTSPSGDTA